MFIAKVKSASKSGKKSTSILLRESYREDKKVRSRTLAILTHLPQWLNKIIEKAVAANPDEKELESLLKQQSSSEIELTQKESFGSIYLVHQVANKLGISHALGHTHEGKMALWQVIARVVQPGVSLLGMVRLASKSAANRILSWTRSFDENDLYSHGKWLRLEYFQRCS